MAWAPPYTATTSPSCLRRSRRAEVNTHRSRGNAGAAADLDTRERVADREAALVQWEQMTRDMAERLAEAQGGYDPLGKGTRADPGPGLCR